MKTTRRLFCLVLTLIMVALSAITVTASADVIVGDFRLSNDQQILVQYLGTDAAPAIPGTVKTIGAAAFKDNDSITSIVIPSTVTSIRDRAFYNCKNLQTVTLPASIDTISVSTFAYCSNLTTVNIPRSVVSIGASAFAHCASLQNLIGPDQQSIGTTVYTPVPAYVTSIGTDAFAGCQHLTVQCFKGSAMETYAKDNNLQYTSVDPLIYKLTANEPQWTTVWARGVTNTVQLGVTIDPTIAASNRLGWSTNNIAICRVNESGLVSNAAAPGTGIVTCYSPDQLDVYVEMRVVVLDARLTWQQDDVGNWYYCTGTSSFATSWHKVGNFWYYFNKYGIMQTGWRTIDGKEYLLLADGKMMDGWYNSSNYDWYFFQNGVLQTGWREINKKWYYFEPNGALGAGKGWMYYGGVYNIGGKNYLFDSTGALVPGGWQLVNGTWYYMGTDGAPVTGWLLYQKKWYYLNPGDGAMAAATWRQIDGKWYYFDGTGAMKTGWVNDGGSWYFLEKTGAMKTGWHKEKKNWYYLMPGTGAMVTGTVVIDGVTYTFNSSGQLIS